MTSRSSSTYQLSTMDSTESTDELQIGDEFNERSEFKEAVFKVATNKNRNVVLKISSGKVQEYVCMTDKCPWLVRAGYAIKRNTWKVLKYEPAHLDSCMPKTNIDGQTLLLNPGFKAAVLSHPKSSMKAILKNSKIVSEHNVDLKKSQLYRLKNKVLKSYDKNYEDSFNGLLHLSKD
jgi:hypothetical protein